MAVKKRDLWLLTAIMALGGCDGTAIFIPEDNTRVAVPPPSEGAPYSIQVLLDEAEHEWALDADLNGLFRLEAYSDFEGGWTDAHAAPPVYTGVAVQLPTGTSYWWRFDIDLYENLGLYSEPGTYGSSFMFRLFIKTPAGDWSPVPGLTVDWRECYRMLNEDGAESCPYTYEVRLRSQYYVPNITRASTGCSYGDDACSRCVSDVLAAVDLHNAGYDINHADLSYDIWGAPSGSLWDPEHNQGIARLADLVFTGHRIGRVVLTHNLSGDGLHYAEHIVGYNTEGIFEPGPYEVIDSIPIRGALNHPGGAQAHGNTVAVAAEHQGSFTPGDDPYAAVYFLHFPPGNSMGGEIVNWLGLDGSQGEPFQADQSRASSAAFVKMESGYFLVAVSGADHGRQGIWFYESSDTTINYYTEWYYVGFWDPPPRPECPSGVTGEGNIDAGCFGGASGMALVADCGGGIYLITMHGSSQTGNDEWQWNQVWRIAQTATGEPDLIFRYWQRDFTGTIQTNNPAFRWAGGAYVVEDGNLAVFNTSRSHAHGDVYYSKY